MRRYAFIDAQNVYLGTKSEGWKIDFQKLRILLREKFSVERAFIFVGFLPENVFLYRNFESFGYTCVFKHAMRLPSGEIKGNVDAELVLHTMIQFPDFDEAIILSGDGDFFCLGEHLLSQGKFHAFFIPNRIRYSGLLKKLSTPEKNALVFLSDMRKKIEKNEKGS